MCQKKRRAEWLERREKWEGSYESRGGEEIGTTYNHMHRTAIVRSWGDSAVEFDPQNPC